MEIKNLESRMAWNFTAKDDFTEIMIYDVIANKQSSSWWSDDVGTEVTPKVFKDELNKATTQKIVIRINSVGGDTTAAEAIRTAIKDARAEGKQITCKIDGLCASAAVGIAAACESVEIQASGWLMIHDPMTFAYGYYSINDFEKGLAMLQAIKRGIVNAYTAKTGKSKEELGALMSAETWYTGEEAVQEGFCDSLMHDESASKDVSNAANNMVVFNQFYKNMPPSLKNHLTRNFEGGFFNPQNSQVNEKERVKKMEIKNAADLKQAYPELVNELVNQAVEGERNRIKAIDNSAVKGFEKIAEDAKYTTPINAGEFALKVLAEQQKQGLNFIANLETDVSNSGLQDVGTTNQEGLGEETENEFEAAINKITPVRG